ncbi:MAG: MBL fold metallo-hydrolase [Ruminococcaceae bacterium]|nr:MBL fold metallo-hydrolase [Oscillospiraceae bacterium]
MQKNVNGDANKKEVYMKITWLGQAGLLFDNGKVKIMVDPYLSNSVEKVEPLNYRRVSVKEEFLSVTPDVMIFTHDHLDHYDPETAPIFLERKEKRMTVLSPSSVWQKARAFKAHNNVQFNRGTSWTEYGFRFTAVKAEHSDPFAIGVMIEDIEEKKIYYVTGDTLYNKEIFKDLPKHIDVVFLPINGVGNNMNETDAVRFFHACGARRAVPYHVGMFDEKSPEIFKADNRIILDIYKETEV